MAIYERKTIVVETEGPPAFYDGAPAKPSGPAAAAILAAGIGSLALGLLTSGAEAIAPLKTFLTFTAAVGPLSGKTTVAVAAYLISWAILAVVYGKRDVAMRPIVAATFVMLAVGLLLTFPLVYQYVL